MEQPQWITTHVTHVNAHVEEYGCLWVFVNEHHKEAVARHFWNARGADFIQWNELPEGTVREHWERTRGYNFFGRWGGEFDEHATETAPRKKGQSALSLVAKKLGIEADPKFAPMLRWISHLDQYRGRSPFHLGALVKFLNYYGGNPKETMPWVFTALEAMYGASPEYFKLDTQRAGKTWAAMANRWMISRFRNRIPREELILVSEMENPTNVARALKIDKFPALERLLEFTKERWKRLPGSVFEPHAIAQAIEDQMGPKAAMQWAFKTLDAIRAQAEDFQLAQFDYRAAKKYHCLAIGKQTVNVVVGDSNSQQLSAFARSAPPKGCYAGLVVSRTKAGNVSIMTGSSFRSDLASVVEALRIAEFRKRGMPLPEDRTLLRRGKELPGGDVWYYFEENQSIHNGTHTRNMPPTALSLDEITRILFAVLGVRFPQAAPRKTVIAQPLVTAPAMA